MAANADNTTNQPHTRNLSKSERHRVRWCGPGCLNKVTPNSLWVSEDLKNGLETVRSQFKAYDPIT